MKPLIVLLVAFTLALFVIKLINGNFAWALSARIGMSVMLVFTAIGHLMYTKGMTMMLPDFIPGKTALVYLTGAIEFLAAIGLLVPRFKIPIAWLLIIFFVLVLPANILAAVKHINYQQGNFSGPGNSYLWFRVPLQLFFILWTYMSCIRG